MFRIKHYAINVMASTKIFSKEKVLFKSFHIFNKGIEHIVSNYLKNHGMSHPSHTPSISQLHKSRIMWLPPSSTLNVV